MKLLISLLLVFNFAFANDLLLSPMYFYMPGNLYNTLGKIEDTKQEVQKKEPERNKRPVIKRDEVPQDEPRQEEPRKVQDDSVDENLVFVCLAFLCSFIAILTTGA